MAIKQKGPKSRGKKKPPKSTINSAFPNDFGELLPYPDTLLHKNYLPRCINDKPTYKPIGLIQHKRVSNYNTQLFMPAFYQSSLHVSHNLKPTCYSGKPVTSRRGKKPQPKFKRAKIKSIPGDASGTMSGTMSGTKKSKKSGTKKSGTKKSGTKKAGTKKAKKTKKAGTKKTKKADVEAEAEEEAEEEAEVEIIAEIIEILIEIDKSINPLNQIISEIIGILMEIDKSINPVNQIIAEIIGILEIISRPGTGK
jgi:hypothetical protein